jgi:hydrogenase expression/formation protein HypE
MVQDLLSSLPHIIYRRLPDGKLPIDVLEPILSSLSTSGKNLVVAPSIGVDVGVTRSNGKYLVTSSDPITGTEKRIGWYAVNVSANDVATSGIMPDSLSVVSLFPSGFGSKQIKSVIGEVDETARSLGITVTGGHTEITPGLHRPILVVTCFGSGGNFVTSSMAREGDSILMTKTAGIEGTSILSRLKVVHSCLRRPPIQRAEKLIDQLSIVEEAHSAFSTGKVHAMHDSTEGGILGCLVEMSLSSKLGFELEEGRVPVDASTKEICDLISIDPLKLIGSGSLIISCSPRDEPTVIRAVSNRGILCVRIGRFTARNKGRILTRADGKSIRIREVSIQDELWPALNKYSKLS